MTHKEMERTDHQYIIQTYNRYPITLVRGLGCRAWDIDGKEYLDCLGGIAVNVLGHCHPEVVCAIREQTEVLLHCSNLYYTEKSTKLAELLVNNGGLGKVMFCNSGAEANEGAFKLVRKFHYRQGHPERTRIISFTGAFHGRTAAALAATPKPKMQEGFGPLAPHFSYVPFGETGALREALDSTVAAVIVEPVQGEGGVVPASKEYMQEVAKLTREFGALLIFDEIQCGMGRLGGHLFAYQSLGVTPDVVTLAKGLGGGLPIGAICASNGVAEVGFQHGDHGTTFGANPVCCAAALATVRTILENDILQQVSEKGAYLAARLNWIKAQFPDTVKEIRGKGLMLGMELTIDAPAVLNECHQQGLLANVASGSILRLLPPYTITRNEMDLAVEMIVNAIGKVRGQMDRSQT